MGAETLSEALIEKEHNEGWKKGANQPNSCRDFSSAVLFIFHILIIATVAGLYSGKAIEDALNDQHNYAGYLYATLVLSLVTLALSALILRVMLEIGKYLIKTLLFSAGIVALVEVAINPSDIISSIIGLMVFLAVSFYTYSVWNRIPVSTANIVTALACIKQNFGILFIAYGYIVVMVLWTMLWLLALIGTHEETKLCSDDGTCHTNYFIFIPFFISYFWAFLVIKNSVWVISAGVVGKWWLEPEIASTCLSHAVQDAVKNATTYSFGSICYGALITPYVQFIEAVINPDGENQCATQCCSSNMTKKFENAVLDFNQWGYVYAGLYGYKFNEGSSKAMEMFKARGWMPVVSDDLLRKLFYLTIFIIGLAMGEVGSGLADITDWFDDDGGFNPQTDGQIFGFAIGYLLSSSLLSVVQGGVFAVIILFAEAEEDLAGTHPDIHANMVRAYAGEYPSLIQ